jgi:BolA family transcriptional regulator, general stress-responsive regulator
MDAPATGPIATEMRRRLESLNPTKVELIDDSEKHRGHGGYNPAGESHFTLLIESPAFSWEVARRAPSDGPRRTRGFLDERVHALSIRARAPGEE